MPSHTPNYYPNQVSNNLTLIINEKQYEKT
nr:hypothetical protein [Mucilaginibacter sp. SP1R1]